VGQLYRAERQTPPPRRVSGWEGKWRRVPNRAIEQAKRWRTKDRCADAYIGACNGVKATLEELKNGSSFANCG
jgi:hypothetical protein